MYQGVNYSCPSSIHGCISRVTQTHKSTQEQEMLENAKIVTEMPGSFVFDAFSQVDHLLRVSFVLAGLGQAQRNVLQKGLTSHGGTLLESAAKVGGEGGAGPGSSRPALPNASQLLMSTARSKNHPSINGGGGKRNHAKAKGGELGDRDTSPAVGRKVQNVSSMCFV